MSVDAQTDRKELIRLLELNANPDDTGSKWTKEETDQLLKLIAQHNCVAQLEDDDAEVYANLSKATNKSADDLRKRWFKLKSEWEDYRAGSLDEFEHSEDMDVLFNGQNDLSKSEIIVIHGEELYNTNLTYDDCIVPKLKSRNWSTQETECMMEVLEKYGLPNRESLKKFVYIAMDHLKQNGFERTEEQIQIKIKNMRRYFFMVIRKDIPESEFPYYQRMKTLISQQNLTATEDSFNNSDHEQEEQEFYLHRRRQMWSHKETNVFLEFIEDNGIVTGKQLSRAVTDAVEYMLKHGFKRTQAQLLVRWKNMKTAYWTSFRKKLKYPDREMPFFTRLHAILNTNNDVTLSSFYKVKNMCSSEDSVEMTRETDFISVDSSFAPETAANLNYDPLVSGNFNNNQPEMSIIKKQKPEVNVSNCNSCSSMDSLDHYCASLASSIRKLDARKQAKLKIEMMQLMYRAEFDSNF